MIYNNLFIFTEANENKALVNVRKTLISLSAHLIVMSSWGGDQMAASGHTLYFDDKSTKDVLQWLQVFLKRDQKTPSHFHHFLVLLYFCSSVQMVAHRMQFR